jgi:hypothetical protein
MIQSHSALEVIERRIVQDRCSGFTHPCEVADVPRERIRQIRRDDSDPGREDRYRPMCRVQLIPAFWPRRPWDSEIIGDLESRRLAELIATADKSGIRKNETEKKKPPPKKGKAHSAAAAPKFPFSVSKLDFSTDDFDEFTEGEF